ncbi:putative DNA ligase [Pseudomonas phage MR6]|uniref:Putative DNA ligase n=1 Tax=Pseudomonas phage MR5 TaxID=2711172 RepID=A0A6M3TCP2_9CAUD|nr:putative DNA ligase [Pseudomonas phage MR5]QJD54850.1 putative DNA ligase [Pseudomonas phage MR6]QJD54909.1 putative DNA ligase [Pseudomonas phage MR7]QJD54970.1 putative DNA ligase [Pseudomonas phage MR8]QJD55027.1 putative DNA ligase [Pseudomonas phage MR12]QJD55330.1 putative DNA ligase [Pseudomonas phage MR18]QJF74594.1 putative DNA ligase [Pseudomonas phage MR16]
MRRLLRLYRNRVTNRLAVSSGTWANAFNGCTTSAHSFGLLVNWRALWIGAHYSPAHKRLCVNLLPGVTLWWTRPGGQLP